jgi:hypothetical protein
MRISTDTGEAILTPAEQAESDNALEELEHIIKSKKNLFMEMTMIGNRFNSVDLDDLKASAEETFNEAFYKEWHKYRDGYAMPVGMPFEIPSFYELQRQLEKERLAATRAVAARNRLSVPTHEELAELLRPVRTNPATPAFGEVNQHNED